ncbi:hypothetical protein R3P38DRAFT_2800975 [Favolaschia claudopus]|uniref:Uncharacterized protein n=1 Tax=Favolaschia claudopus TaxID=2862362 RepID=A0AAV9ZWK7_9AGAR
MRLFDVRESFGFLTPESSSTPTARTSPPLTADAAATRASSIPPLRTPTPPNDADSEPADAPQYVDDPAGFNAVNIFSNTPTLPSVISLLATATRHTPVSVLFGSMLGGTEEARSFPSPDVGSEHWGVQLRINIKVQTTSRLSEPELLGKPS